MPEKNTGAQARKSLDKTLEAILATKEEHIELIQEAGITCKTAEQYRRNPGILRLLLEWNFGIKPELPEDLDTTIKLLKAEMNKGSERLSFLHETAQYYAGQIPGEHLFQGLIYQPSLELGQPFLVLFGVRIELRKTPMIYPTQRSFADLLYQSVDAYKLPSLFIPTDSAATPVLNIPEGYEFRINEPLVKEPLFRIPNSGEPRKFELGQTFKYARNMLLMVTP